MFINSNAVTFLGPFTIFALLDDCNPAKWSLYKAEKLD